MSKHRKKSTVLIGVGLCLAILALIVGVARWQPTRHVIYNNTGDGLFTFQQHHGVSIKKLQSRDINPPFDVGLMIRFQFGGLDDGTSGQRRVRFGEDGVIRISDSTDGKAWTVELPASMAEDGMVGRSFRYQINPDGALYMLAPGQTPPLGEPANQPPGFPVVLFDERPVTWPEILHDGVALELMDPVTLERFRFNMQGYAAASIGKKEGPVAAPAIYWRVEGNRLVLSIEREGKAFEDLSDPTLQGNVLRVRRPNGERVAFMYTRAQRPN